MLRARFLQLPHCVFAICAFMYLSAPALAQDYHIQDLGALADYESVAYDINNQNQIAGVSHVFNPGPGPLYFRHGFLWAQGTMTDLGTLPGGNESRAFAINPQGWIAGWSDDASGPANPVFRGEGDWVEIPQPGQSGEGRGINAHGRVVGYFVDKTFATRAFAWSALGSFTDLSLVGGAGDSLANAINLKNQAVGWSRIGPNPCGIFSASKPTLWERDSSGQWTATGLPYTGCAGNVFGLNDWGTLVGGVSVQVLTEVPTMWVWRGSWFEFTLDLAGYSSGTAYDINKHQQIVGRLGTQAFLWDGGTPVDLNAEIPAGSGWVLETARAINDCGWITGYGKLNGTRHGYVLIPKYSVGCC